MLEGIRVLDLSDETGFLAGKILADLGADVIKLESPGGDPARHRGPYLKGVADPERSLAWLAMNTSKRGITLDLDTEADRFLGLARGADVILETFAPGEMQARGLGFATLREENPALVYCALTPFGQTGPRARYRAHDLVAVAMGGNQAVTGDPDRPPIRCSQPTAYFHAGPEAALGILMALYAREITGRGQFVDVSLQECQLQSLLSYPGQYAMHRRPIVRSGARLGRTREIWAARDGWVSYGLRGGPARIRNLIATVEYMAESGLAPQWLRDYDWERFNHNELSDEEIARFEEAFGAFFASKKMRELYEEALKRRILLAPCNNAAEILDHPQLRDRKLFVRVEYPELEASLEHPDFFARLGAHPIRVRRRAPRLGEHNAEIRAEAEAGPEVRVLPVVSGSGTLEGGVFRGLRVLEMGSGAAGPVATRYFAEQGARVIRVESGTRPDFLRVLFLTKDSRFGMDGSPMFILLNPSKESVTLDLTKSEGVELVRKLMAWADVVCENFAPGVMAKFGLDYEKIRGIKPDIVYASGCLFGQTGPQRAYPGFGGQGSAIAGFNHVTGWPDREGHGPYGTITDSLSPRYVATAIAAALLRRRRTGEGEYIDLSQIECGVYSLSEMLLRYSGNGEIAGRLGNHHESAAPHAAYPCRGEDRWIALSVFRDEEWQALVEQMGNPAWADARFATVAGRLGNQDELDAQIGAWTRGFDAPALMDRLQRAGVEAGVVQDFADLLADSQLAHRRHWIPLVHDHLGELPFERSGFRLSESAGGHHAPGPNLGEHNHAVLGDLLGLADEEIARLVEAGVVR